MKVQPKGKSFETSLPGISKKDEKLVLKKYKGKLIKLVISLIFLCIILLVERIFYSFIENWETSVLIDLQKALGITDNKRLNWFTQAISSLGEFRFLFLLYTHVFVILYFGFDAFLCIKVMYVLFIGFYILSCLNMLYESPRPYWVSREITAYSCENNYSHPSIFFFGLLFLICYLYHCYFQRYLESKTKSMISENYHLDNLDEWEFSEKTSRTFKIIEIVCIVLFIGVMFFRYCIGTTFIFNILLALVYFGLYYYIVVFSENYIDLEIKNLSLMKIEAKRKSFYYFLYLLFATSFATIIYFIQQNDKIPVEWINNYVSFIVIFKMRCIERKDEDKVYPIKGLIGNFFIYIIGMYPTFLESSLLFALMGSIFGVARCFRHVKTVFWFKGPAKMRIIRTLISTAFLIPSWIIVSFQKEIVEFKHFNLILISEFFFNAIHFSLLYFFIFGILPTTLLERWNLINTELANYSFLQSYS